MATAFVELRVLQDAEAVADEIWRQVAGWEPFAREVVGGQLARSADSVGANIAEAFAVFITGRNSSFCIMRVAVFSRLITGSTGL